jgi:cation transport regulator ChaB
MAYQNTSELPNRVRNVRPKHAQAIDKEAFNAAVAYAASSNASGRI